MVTPGEYGAPRAVQDTPTGFGNSNGFPGSPGSELDAAFGRIRGDGGLELALTGNLEAGGNAIVVFFDVRAGGAVASTLPGGFGVLGAFGGQRTDDWGTDIDGGEGIFSPSGPSILDPGFNPDFAIEFNVADGNRHVNVIDMAVGGNDPSLVNRDVYLGPTPELSPAVTQDYYRDGGATFSGQVRHDFFNANDAGVNGFDTNNPPGPLGDPLSAMYALEYALSPEFVDADPDRPIHVMAFITNGGGDFLSNQFLPGLGGPNNLGGTGNPGGEPLFDAREFPGNQFFTIPARVRGDYNGNGVVDAADYTTWRNSLGELVEIGEGADGDRDGEIDLDDYLEWKARYGNTAVSGSGSAVLAPEPAGVLLALFGLVAMAAVRWPRWYQFADARRTTFCAFTTSGPAIITPSALASGPYCRRGFRAKRPCGPSARARDWRPACRPDI
jgi:hypothetical protein